jgi:hypothetical protein
MSDLTQEEIDRLIRCPKVISDPPRKEMAEDRGSLRNNMKLTAKAGQAEFFAFMRRNADFSENFSIGLEYCPRDGSGRICLLRCNGPHGGWIDDFHDPDPHFRYHIHLARAENIEAGFRAERGAEVTKEYASYQEALRYFVRRCQIGEAGKYFPELEHPHFDFERLEPQS